MFLCNSYSDKYPYGSQNTHSHQYTYTTLKILL